MDIALVEPDTAGRRIEVLREMLLTLGQRNTETINLVREPNGKQKLVSEDGGKWYCNFSRVRNAPKSFGLVVLSGETQHGIDVEVWPESAADADFLESISTFEDARAIRSLASLNRDTGTALWVIKEAALKCTGDVMIDPRHLTVSPFRDGIYRISPSPLAGAPVPDVIVALFSIRALKWPETEFICGVALPYSDRIVETAPTNPVFAGTGWQIMALKTRTHS